MADLFLAVSIANNNDAYLEIISGMNYESSVTFTIAIPVYHSVETYVKPKVKGHLYWLLGYICVCETLLAAALYTLCHNLCLFVCL